MGEESLMVELLVCQWQKGNTGNKRAEISAMLSFFSSPDLRRTKNKRKAEEQVRIIIVRAYASPTAVLYPWDFVGEKTALKYFGLDRNLFAPFPFFLLFLS